MSLALQRCYPEVRFGGFSAVDGTIAFYTRVRALVNPNSVVLDAGCGRGAWSTDPVVLRRDVRTLYGKCGRLIGIDVDPAGQGHPLINEFRQIRGSIWPIEDESVDVCVSDFVIEHVEDVEAFFKNCHRILKPRGYLCIRTPNVLSYFGVLSMLVPNRHHRAVVQSVKKSTMTERQEQTTDIFPTSYKCNTLWKMRRTLERFGFDGVVMGFEGEPAYFDFSQLAYSIAAFVHRHNPEIFRSVLFAFGQKLQ